MPQSQPMSYLMDVRQLHHLRAGYSLYGVHNPARKMVTALGKIRFYIHNSIRGDATMSIDRVNGINQFQATVDIAPVGRFFVGPIQPVVIAWRLQPKSLVPKALGARQHQALESFELAVLPVSTSPLDLVEVDANDDD